MMYSLCRIDPKLRRCSNSDRNEARTGTIAWRWSCSKFRIHWSVFEFNCLESLSKGGLDFNEFNSTILKVEFENKLKP